MNPFSLPTNDASLYLYREQQRILKSEHDKEQRLIPIYDRSPEIKIPIIAEFRKSVLPSITSPTKFRRNSCVAIREELPELIQRKREMLLVKKSIENKLKNIEMLENSVSEREKAQKEFMRKIEDELRMFEKYEEKLMTETRKKSENAKRKNWERVEIQESLKKLNEEIESMQIYLEQKVEDLKKYEKIKEFVEEIRKSLNDDLESLFVTEQSSLFRAPLQILDLLNAYESKSLLLVTQVERDEQELEMIRANNLAGIKEIEANEENLQSQIRVLEKQKEVLVEKLSKYEGEENEDKMMSEETLQTIHLKLIEMVGLMGIETSLQITDLDFLELIETKMQQMAFNCQAFPEESIKKHEKEIDRFRRSENIKKKESLERKKILENDEKLRLRKTKVLKKQGRTLKPKSKIAEKSATTKTEEIPQDILDRIEFLDEPFSTSSKKS